MRHSANGYETYGFDVNPFSPYRDDSVLGMKWDAVTAWDVVEHMASPVKWASNLNTRFLFLLTPDATSLHGKFTGWKHFKTDEHQHYFTKESLARFMDRAGYCIRELNHDEGALRDPKHPGWLVTVVGERV